MITLRSILPYLFLLSYLPQVGHTSEESILQGVMAVSKVRPTQAVWKKSVRVNGEVVPWQYATIASQLAGQSIISLSVQVGDKVKRGQIVAKLSNFSLLAQRRSLEAQHHQAEINTSLAKLNFERASKLKESRNITDQAIEQIKAQYDIALSQTMEIAARRDLLDNDINFSTIVAPDDGIVSEQLASLGQVVGVGTELFKIIRREQLEWRGNVAPTLLPEIVLGQSVIFDLPDGSKIEGLVCRIDPTANISTRLITLSVSLPQHAFVKNGMVLQGNLLLRDEKVISIPAKSVVLRDGKSYLAKINQINSRFYIHLLSVSTGQRNGNDISILSKLNPEDSFVLDGAGLLNEGDAITVIETNKDVH